VSLRAELDERGFALRAGAVGDELRALVGKLLPEPMGAAGVRNLLWDRPELRPVLAAAGLDQLASEALGADAFPINVTAFDKTPEANWKVPGHQDLMVPVESRRDVPGWDGWTTKAGVLYAEPPAEILGQLVALRLHLDDCPVSNGPLAVVPGSHRRGKLRDAELAALAPESFVPCAAAAGDVLLMRPLLVHRSGQAEAPRRRRVLHVVYAADDPAPRLHWRTSSRKDHVPPTPTPPVELHQPPPERPPRRSRLPAWLEIVLGLLWLATSVLGIIAFIASLWHEARGPSGAQLHQTFYGYKVSPIGALVTVVLMLAAGLLGGVVAWWQGWRERRLLERLRRKRTSDA
jgi:hypothetical protein